jgi:hypothetical protein
MEYGALYKSTNQGATWVSIATATSALTVSVSNPSVLYRTSSGSLYKTTDGGTTWAAIAGNLPSETGIIAVSPVNSSILYAASPAGLYLSTDGGTTWNPAASGLGLAVPSQIVLDPTNTGTAYVVSTPAQSSAFVAEINPTGSSLVYSTYLGGSATSTGNGIATALGDAFVAGTSSGTLPGSSLFQNTPTLPAAFVARITGSASPCTYAVSPLIQNILSQAQSALFTVVAPAGCAWTASSNQTWATIVAGVSGSGTGVVEISVPANTSAQTQSATLTVGGQQATLSQAASNCTYNFSNLFSVPATGGTVTVNLTAGPGCPWTVTNNNPSAIMVTSAASGTGSATITLTVGAIQPPQVRYLYVPITGGTIEIAQTSSCSYTLSPANTYLPASGGTGSITVTVASECQWSVGGPSWLTVGFGEGQGGFGSGGIPFTAAPNTGAIRSYTFTIGGQSATVTQAAPQSYVVSTIAGSAVPATAVPALSAGVSPSAIATDAAGNTYFASLSAVYRVDPKGILTRVAGTGAMGFSGDNGPAVSAQLSNVGGIAVDAAGNLFITDLNNARLRRVSVNGTITTVAGTGSPGYNGDNLPATTAQIYYPGAVAVDAAGNLFFTDDFGMRVRRIDKSPPWQAPARAASRAITVWL